MKNIETECFSLKPIAVAIGAVLAFTNLNVSAAEAEEEGAEAASKIVVTGSRIRRDEVNDEQPIQVILASDAKVQGIQSVGQLLRSSSLASGSNQVTAATSSAFVQNGGTGSETISLRGLGPQKTLVLLNGRKAGPAGTRGGVSSFDLNTIPMSAVDRIEILKDGASSLYGSDAVAGVINIITKTDEGGQIDFFTSQPSQSGGEESSLSLSYGKSFEKGSFRVSSDLTKRSELARGDRDFYACGERRYYDVETGDRADNIDPRTGNYHCSDLLWGHVWIYDYSGDPRLENGELGQYDYDGNLGTWLDPIGQGNPGGNMNAPDDWYLVGRSGALANADHPFQDLQTLSPETDLMTLYVDANYELSDSVELYTEILVNRRETKVNGYRQYWGYIYNEDFFGGNDLSEGWTGAQWLSPTPITDHSYNRTEVDFNRFLIGAEGEVGDWYWDASAKSSRSLGTYTNAIIYKDSVEDQNWLTGSCVGTTTSVNGFDCIDIPWLDPQFLAGNVSPEMQAFLFGEDTGTTEYSQKTIEANITGDLFEVPAGYVGAAFGIQFQKDWIKDTPGMQTLNQNAWGASSAGITTGEYKTNAIYGELAVPLLADLPGIESLKMSASARYTEVDVINESDTTYKLSLAWKIGAGLTVRGSHGTSFRAPKLFELYLADQTSFAGQRSVDPCINWGNQLADGQISQRLADNCAADGVAADHTAAISATVITSGGLKTGLQSETSTANTWGIVWRPEFAELNVSIDYFDYHVEDEVGRLGPGGIVFGCYNSENFEVESLCNFFERRTDVDNGVDNILDGFINIAEQRNIGWDLMAEYSTELPWGSLGLRTEQTFQRQSAQGLDADTVRDNNGNFGDPKHSGTFLAVFKKDDWSVNWFMNYTGGVDNTNLYEPEALTFTWNGRETTRDYDAGSHTVHTLSYGYNMPDSNLELTAGIRNLFDKEPPRVTSGVASRWGSASTATQYDVFGRSVFLNLSYNF